MPLLTELIHKTSYMDEEERCEFIEDLKRKHPELLKDIDDQLSFNADFDLTKILSVSASYAVSSDIYLESSIVGKYKLQNKLGSGGIGVVYKAERNDQTFEQSVAVKFIQPALVNVIGRWALFREAQLLASLNHPNIAKVFDGGEHEGHIYISMEWIDGSTLGDYLKNKNISKNKKLNMFIDICSALEHAHSRNIIHGDIKPSNIIIDEIGRAKLIDFNLFIKTNTGSDIEGISAFTSEYSSPEQLESKELTQSIDIYSAGKLLEALNKDNISQELEKIINKSTQHESSNRYSNITELKNDVKNILEIKPISMMKGSYFYILKKFIKRRRFTSLLILIVFITLITFWISIFLKNKKIEFEKKAAESLLFEIANLLHYNDDKKYRQATLDTMLDLTRRKILSNQDISDEMKGKLLKELISPSKTYNHK
jgi:serine/threonine protein kinase